eukprot:scaffold17430_cov36-Attheya_sp.AAC.1
MNTPATIGKLGRRPTIASTKSFLHPLFVVMLAVCLLLLPAAVPVQAKVGNDLVLQTELEQCKARVATLTTRVERLTKECNKECNNGALKVVVGKKTYCVSDERGDVILLVLH